MWVLCLHESHAEEQQGSVHRGKLCVDTVRGSVYTWEWEGMCAYMASGMSLSLQRQLVKAHIRNLVDNLSQDAPDAHGSGSVDSPGVGSGWCLQG